jgi:dihydrofolate reductase
LSARRLPAPSKYATASAGKDGDMRRLVVSEFLTLDGVMQAPGDANEDRDGGFEHGGWQISYFDDEFGTFVMKGLADAGAFLLGRLTYQNFAAFWPDEPADDPIASQMNATPKYVVSTTLSEPLPWQNSHLITNGVADRIRELKAEGGKDIQVAGSGQLVQTLIHENLVDEYQLMVHPIVLGGGKRLFRDGLDLNRLELIDSATTTKGVLLLRYRPTA